MHGEYAAPPRSGSLYSEQDWNDTSTADNGQGYHLSKVRTGRACCLGDAQSLGSLLCWTAAGRAEVDQHVLEKLGCPLARLHSSACRGHARHGGRGV